MDTLHTLITEEEIQSRIRSLAEEISKDYEGKDLHMVGVLKGAFMFLADLVRAMRIPTTIYFMQASSYGNRQSSSGEVMVRHDLVLADKHVLVVEDILDTGLTMNKIMDDLSLQTPSSLKLCALLDKTEGRKVQVPAQYVGFHIPNKFVIGYGMDYAEQYRDLPYIAYLEP